jgi:hypothetical protein
MDPKPEAQPEPPATFRDDPPKKRPAKPIDSPAEKVDAGDARPPTEPSERRVKV